MGSCVGTQLKNVPSPVQLKTANHPMRTWRGPGVYSGVIEQVWVVVPEGCGLPVSSLDGGLLDLSLTNIFNSLALSRSTEHGGSSYRWSCIRIVTATKWLNKVDNLLKQTLILIKCLISRSDSPLCFDWISNYIFMICVTDSLIKWILFSSFCDFVTW